MLNMITEATHYFVNPDTAELFTVQIARPVANREALNYLQLQEPLILTAYILVSIREYLKCVWI